MSIDIKDNESRTVVEITLTQNQLSRLKSIAESLGVSMEELLQNNVEEMLHQREAAFQEAADYVLTKNAELYRRLA